MLQNYTFFIQDNKIELLRINVEGKEIFVIENKKKSYPILLGELPHLIEKVKQDKECNLEIKSNIIDLIVEKILTQFDIHLLAAGGLVFNSEQEILFIFRNGFWDLPKGKIEPNETIEQTAIREVEEETGIRNIQLGNSLPTTFHTYIEREKWVLKESRWFEMRIENNQQLRPQIEEGITQIKWVSKKERAFYIAKSYPNIQDLFSKIKSAMD